MVVNVSLSIRSIGHGVFSTTLGKKYTGHHPWCMMHTCIFIGYKINISVFFLHKRKRVISLGSKNEMCFIILHHCQIRGSPRPMTFTFDFYTRCAQQKCLVKLSIFIQFFFFKFLCRSVVKTSDNEKQNVSLTGTFVCRSCNLQ